MPTIVAVHSFRGGTGKSNITANLCLTLALAGRRVGVIDTDIQSPGIHLLLGLSAQTVKHALNDYLWGDCEIEQASYDVTDGIGADIPGRLFFVPSSSKIDAITRVLREGYDVALLRRGFHRLIEARGLDMLLIDTHPGVNEETLLSMAISDVLLVILRPDQQDYEGTSITVEVGRMLGVPRLLLAINKVPSMFDPEVVKTRVERAYTCPVAAVLPHAEEFLALASGGLFVQRYPSHPITAALRTLADELAR
jgi:MinD-like ATPase involved in chromosome partitioning or flagellar assembly